jgi:hypothetical protein
MINMVDSLCAFCNETQDKIIIQYNNKLHPRSKKSSPSPLFHSPFEMPPKPEKSSNSTKKSSKTKSASPILKTCHEIRNNPSIINKRDKLNDVKTRCKQTIDDKGNQCIFSQKGRCKKRS